MALVGLGGRAGQRSTATATGSWELGAGLRCHVDPIPKRGRAGTTGLAITPKGYGHRFLDDQSTVAISMRRISKFVRGNIQYRTVERRTQRELLPMSEAGVTVARHYSLRQPASFAEFENSAKLFGVILYSLAADSETGMSRRP